MCRRGNSGFVAQATAITVRPEKAELLISSVSKFLTIINWIGLFSYILSQVRKRG